jgi:redox-sensitive bicupin YhaK (pirin superfamily)
MEHSWPTGHRFAVAGDAASHYRGAMITLRLQAERGATQVGWLDSRHSFSFGDYVDPQHMGFRALRVINEDRVRPGQGFGTHPHRDMEILSYVISGQLGHQDSIGNGSVIRPGEIQRMSAGTGVLHSEMNPSTEEPVHFLQIWIVPERRGIEPGYEQKSVPTDSGLHLVGRREGGEGAVTIHQDVRLYLARLAAKERLTVPLATGRHAWVQAVRGSLGLDDVRLEASDGAAVSDVRQLTLQADEPAEALIFDLA